MKKIFLIFILLSAFFCSCIESRIQKSEPRYRLFETQNFWTFIQLDTATGKMW